MTEPVVLPYPHTIWPHPAIVAALGSPYLFGLVALYQLAAVDLGRALLVSGGAFGMATLAILTAHGRAARRSVAHVSSDGIHLGGPRGRAIPVGETLVLRGRVGGVQTLVTDGTVFAALPQPDWAFAQVTEHAERCATLLGVPLDDQRDGIAWMRWETDPMYRAALEFRERAVASERRAPQFHARFAQPETTEDLAGATYTVATSQRPEVFALTTLQLEHGGLVLPWTEVHDAAVMVGNLQIRLEVLTDAGDICLLSTTPEVTAMGQMNWLAQRIRETADRGGRDLGSESDVPVALGSLRVQREPSA